MKKISMIAILVLIDSTNTILLEIIRFYANLMRKAQYNSQSIYVATESTIQAITHVL